VGVELEFAGDYKRVGEVSELAVMKIGDI